MTYWLCLLCCIQTSFYAHPVVRKKHMNTFLKIPDARSELRLSDSEYPEFNVKSLPFGKNIPQQELNLLNRNSPLGKKTQYILSQNRERNKDKDHVNHNSHTDHWRRFILTTENNIENENNPAQNKFDSTNSLQPPINHKHISHISKSGQSTYVYPENDELDGESNSESDLKINETETLTYDDDLEASRISSLVVTVEQENDMNNMNVQAPPNKKIAAPSIEIYNRNENNTKLNKTLRNAFARAPVSYFFPSENTRFTNEFKRYKHNYHPNKREYSSDGNLNLDANQFVKNGFSQIQNTEVNNVPFKLKSKPNLNIVQNPYLDSISGNNLANLESSVNRLPKEFQDTIDQPSQLDVINNDINKPLGVKSKSKSNIVQNPYLDLIGANGPVSAESSNNKFPSEVQETIDQPSQLDDINNDGIKKPFGVKSNSKSSIVQNPYLDSIGANDPIDAKSNNNKFPNEIHETIDQPSQLDVINNDLKEEGEMNMDNNYFVTPIDINEIKLSDQYKDELRNNKETRKKQGYSDEAEERKSGSQISDNNALSIESDDAYVPLQKPVVPLKSGSPNQYQQFVDFKSPLDETNPPRNMMQIANEKGFKGTGSEQDLAFQSSGGASNFEPLGNSIPIEGMQPEQTDKGIQLETIPKPLPIHIAPNEHSEYKKGLHNKQKPDTLLSANPLKSSHHDLEGGNNPIDVPQSNPYSYPDSSALDSKIVKDNLDIPLSEERFESNLKSMSDFNKNPFFETNRYALGNNPEMLKTFENKMPLKSKVKKESTDPTLNNKGNDQDCTGYVNNSDITTDMIPIKNSSSYENASATKDNSTGLQSFYNTVSGKIQDIINRTKEMFNFQTTENEHTGCGLENSTKCNATEKNPPQTEKNEKTIRKKSVLNDHRDLLPVIKDSDEITTILNSDFYKTFNDDTVAEAYFESTWDPYLKEKQGRIISELTKDDLIRGSGLRHLYPRGDRKTLNSRFNNIARDTEEDQGKPTNNVLSSKSQKFGHKFKPNFKTYETPIAEDHKYSNKMLLGNNLDELNYFSGEHQPSIKKHFENDESDDSSKNELREKANVPGDFNVDDNFGLKFKPKYKTYENLITDDQKYSNKMLRGNNLDELNHFSGEHHPAVKNPLENDENDDSSKNELREKANVPGDFNVGDNFGLKFKPKTYETPITDDQKYSNKVLLGNNMDELNHFSGEHHPAVKNPLENDESNDSPENVLREKGYAPGDLNLGDNFGLKLKPKTYETPITDDQKYSNDVLLGNNLDKLNHFSGKHHPIIKKHLKIDQSDDSPENGLRENGYVRKELNSVVRNKKFLDANPNRDDKNSEMEQKLSRKLEDVRTKQTVLRDGKTKKETNIIEKENKRVLDSIRFTGNSRMNSNKDEFGNRLGEPNSAQESPENPPGNSPQLSFDRKKSSGVSSYGANRNEFSLSTLSKDSYRPEYESDEGEDIENSPTFTTKLRPTIPLSEKAPNDKNEDNHNNKPDISSGNFKQNDIHVIPLVSNVKDLNIKDNPQSSVGEEKYSKDNRLETNNENELGTDSSMFFPTSKEELEDYLDAEKSIEDEVRHALKFSGKSSDFYKSNKSSESGTDKEIPKNIGTNINDPIKYNSENDDAQDKHKPLTEEPAEDAINLIKDRNQKTSLQRVENHPIAFNSEENDAEVPMKILEEHKANRVPDYDDSAIPSANSGAEDNELSNEYDSVSQKMDDIENNNDEHPTATLISNGDKELKRIEKVEKQSNIVIKSKGSITNQTSRLVCERKTDIRNNKKIYHEAYVQEKVERNYPKTYEDNHGKINLKDPATQAKSIDTTMENITDDESDTESPITLKSTMDTNLSEIKPFPKLTQEPNNVSDYVPPRPESVSNLLESIKRSTIQEDYASNDRTGQKSNDDHSDNVTEKESDYVTEEDSDYATEEDYYDDTTEESEDERLNKVQGNQDQIGANINPGLNDNSKASNGEDLSRRSSEEPVINLSNSKVFSRKIKPSVETGIEQLENQKHQEVIDKIRAKIKAQLSNSKEDNEGDSRMMPYHEPSNLKYSSIKAKPSVETALEQLEDKKYREEIDKIKAKINSGLTDSKASDKEDSRMRPYNEPSNLKYSSIKTQPSVETGIEQLDYQKNQEIDKIRDKIKSGISDLKTKEDSKMMPYIEPSNLKYSSIKTTPSVESRIEQSEDQKNKEEIDKIRAKIKSGITDSKTSEEDSKMMPYNEPSNLKHSSIKTKPLVETEIEQLEDQQKLEIDKIRAKIEAQLRGNSKPRKEEDSRMRPYRGQIINLLNQIGSSSKTRPSVESGKLGNGRSRMSDDKPLDAEILEQSESSETEHDDAKSGLDFETPIQTRDQQLKGNMKDFEEAYRGQQGSRRRNEKSINFTVPSEETQDKVFKLRSAESKTTASSESIPVEKRNETAKSLLDNRSGNMIYMTMKTTTDKHKMLSDFVDIQKVRRYSREFHS